MADDPRLEVVAKAIVNAGFHPPFYVATWSKIFTAAFDALRAFDQAQPQDADRTASVMAAHFHRQRAWSLKTFGPGNRTAGVLDHIRKELREIEVEPLSLEEWIDVAILAFDGAWRTGATPEQIVTAWMGKQSKNEARDWPDWRTMPGDKAIEHVGVDTAPAPVMGADPFWLDEAAEIAYYAWMETKSGDYGWRNVVRAVLAFANAQPPSDAEIDAALAGWRESIRKHSSDVGQNAPNHMRAALIAAAKVRNGA